MNDFNSAERPGESTGPSCAVQVTTGARLHFGLIDTVAPFGGVGVMVDQPATEVHLSKSESFRCPDELSRRLRPIVTRIAQMAGLPDPPDWRIDVVQRARSHCGLGSGTQLALATSEALCQSIGMKLSADDLAIQIAGRGKRSAIGIHGYFSGGLIYERKDQPGEKDLNPIHLRSDLPTDWRVALLRPVTEVAQVSGDLERRQFSKLPAAPNSVRQSLEDLAIQIMQTAQHGDFESFTDMLEKYNHRSGMLFQSVQKGPYNGPEVTHLIETLRRHGVRGVGQSSWGPGVFAWFESAAAAQRAVDSLPPSIETIAVATPCNHPRRLTIVG